MIGLKIDMDGDGAWKDIEGIEGEAVLERVALLREGMQSGRASVALLMRTKDGKAFMAETSLRLFLGAARAFAAVAPDQD